MNRLGTFFKTQVNNNYCTSVHPKLQSWHDPSSTTFADARMHSTDSKVLKNTSTKKKSTNTKINFQKQPINKSSDYGMISTQKPVDTPHQYLTTWSAKLITPGATIKISQKDLKFWAANCKHLEITQPS